MAERASSLSPEERFEYLEMIDELDDEEDAAAMCMDLNIDLVDTSLPGMIAALRDH
eukprot:SAG31_NODE_9699_length_1240_cov_1.452235_1_plen_55_part_10